MQLFVWSGLILVLMTVVGFGWLMHMVPPPSPAASKQEMLDSVREHQTPILIGAALVTFFWSTGGPGRHRLFSTSVAWSGCRC